MQDTIRHEAQISQALRIVVQDFSGEPHEQFEMILNIGSGCLMAVDSILLDVLALEDVA